MAEYVELLLAKADMLKEYFSFELVEAGQGQGQAGAEGSLRAAAAAGVLVKAVPQPIEQYVPPLAGLPELL
eukprot:SAG22_NODE_1470_length_4346_cov_26.858724_1_plen_70_part_10